MEVDRHNPLLDLDFEGSALWDCLELRMFELDTPMGLRNQDLQRISAIKSKKIEKIIICRRSRQPFLEEITWTTRLDGILTNLAGQLEGDTKLEVQFRYGPGECQSSDQEISLPGFVKQGGRVTIWGLDNNLVYYPDAIKSPDYQ